MLDDSRKGRAPGPRAVPGATRPQQERLRSSRPPPRPSMGSWIGDDLDTLQPGDTVTFEGDHYLAAPRRAASPSTTSRPRRPRILWPGRLRTCRPALERGEVSHVGPSRRRGEVSQVRRARAHRALPGSRLLQAAEAEARDARQPKRPRTTKSAATPPRAARDEQRRPVREQGGAGQLGLGALDLDRRRELPRRAGQLGLGALDLDRRRHGSRRRPAARPLTDMIVPRPRAARAGAPASRRRARAPSGCRAASRRRRRGAAASARPSRPPTARPS